MGANSLVEPNTGDFYFLFFKMGCRVERQVQTQYYDKTSKLPFAPQNVNLTYMHTSRGMAC